MFIASAGCPATLAELGVGEPQLADVADAALERPQLANTPDPPGRDELLAYLRAALSR